MVEGVNWTSNPGGSWAGGGRPEQVLSGWAEDGTEELTVPVRDWMESRVRFPGGFGASQQRE